MLDIFNERLELLIEVGRRRFEPGDLQQELIDISMLFQSLGYELPPLAIQGFQCGIKNLLLDSRVDLKLATNFKKDLGPFRVSSLARAIKLAEKTLHSGMIALK